MGPVSCTFSAVWFAGDVEEPGLFSKRVGHMLPGVVVWPLSHGFVLHIKLTSLQLSSLDITVQEKNTDTPQKTGTRKLKRQQTNTIKTHMARSDF